MTTRIALLRGINVGGHNKVPMAELRGVCEDLGFEDVRTYIQSGNVVFGSRASARALETDLEVAVAAHFGLEVPVIVRSATQWRKAMAGNPFSQESDSEPNLVLLASPKRKAAAGAVAELRERANRDERIERVGDDLWFHFAGGVARSKLSPAVVDRAVGSTVTSRNWRTVVKLAEMTE